MEYKITDRYKSMGIPYPDPDTICKGSCEGTGWVPTSSDETEEPFLSLWKEAHKKCSAFNRFKRFFRFKLARTFGWKMHLKVIFGKCDGWHFIKCPDCTGTGKRTDHS